MYNLLTKLPLLLVVGLVFAFFALDCLEAVGFAFEALSVAFAFTLGHFEALQHSPSPCPFLCSPCFGQI